MARGLSATPKWCNAYVASRPLQTSTLSLTTSKISPHEVWDRNIPPPAPFPLSPQSLSSQFNDHIMLHFKFWSNVKLDWTCSFGVCVRVHACLEISLQYVDHILLLAFFRVFMVLHWCTLTFASMECCVDFGN
jgi:hypothetical protein